MVTILPHLHTDDTPCVEAVIVLEPSIPTSFAVIRLHQRRSHIIDEVLATLYMVRLPRTEVLRT
jgi:hypothetical protein